MNLPQFFAELKRRNVYKVAVAYVVAGWALAQGLAQVLPVFSVPNWVIQLLVLLIILGLPVALSLAWAFELPRISLVPRLGLGRGRATEVPTSVISHELREITAEIAALYVFDLGPLAVAPLVSVGWGLFRHEIETDGICAAPPCTEVRNPQGLVTTVGGWAAWPLGHGFSLEAVL